MLTGSCLALVLCTVSCMAQEKQFKETITRTIENVGDELVVRNVFGPITVAGYNGSAIQLEVDRELFADTPKDLEVGKKELNLEVSNKDGISYVHPTAPYITFNEHGLKFDWCNKDEQPAYQHKLSFRIKVPYGLALDVSTINEGDIKIENTNGKRLKVSNINGGIALQNVSGTTELNCINGEVSISYTKNPTAPSKYYALNGDMEVSYQTGLSANVTFKTMNGELYSDFAIARQYNKTQKVSQKGKARFKYESRPVLQIGAGDVALDFETLNGSVYLKKI